MKDSDTGSDIIQPSVLLRNICITSLFFIFFSNKWKKNSLPISMSISHSWDCKRMDLLTLDSSELTTEKRELRMMIISELSSEPLDNKDSIQNSIYAILNSIDNHILPFIMFIPLIDS